MSGLTVRQGRLVAIAAVLLLVVTGCADDKIIASTGTGQVGENGQGSESGGDAGDPDANEGDDKGDDPAVPTTPGADFVTIDGVPYPFAFSGFTTDESNIYARATLRQCEPNLSRTGLFQAYGYLVDENNSVLFAEKGWEGLMQVALMARDDYAMPPNIGVEFAEPGPNLNLTGTAPESIDGSYTVDGNIAVGSFLVPDLNGGPAQRVEFQITCPG